MITIDCTKGKIIKYEVTVEYHELTFRIVFHSYIDARSLFMELINEDIKGLYVQIVDLSGLPDC